MKRLARHFVLQYILYIGYILRIFSETNSTTSYKSAPDWTDEDYETTDKSDLIYEEAEEQIEIYSEEEGDLLQVLRGEDSHGSDGGVGSGSGSSTPGGPARRNNKIPTPYPYQPVLHQKEVNKLKLR